jgi:hypothetical protein
VALGGEEVEELLADFGAFHKLAALAAWNSKPVILNERAKRRDFDFGRNFRLTVAFAARVP